MTKNTFPRVDIAGEKNRGTVVAIGKFEGVHRGHQQLLEKLLAAAKEKNLTSVILTFENNPLSVLNPEACPDPLMSPAQRREALLRQGVDEVLMIPFTEDLADLTAAEFIENLLAAKLNTKHVIVGDDFRFGKLAQGTPQLLREYGPRLGFDVTLIEEVQNPGTGRISSTRIREAVTSGDVRLAAELLGHPHTLRGVVVDGDKRGRELGVPTANLGPAPGQNTVEGMIPSEGVYAGFAKVQGKKHQAAVSVGNNPTFTPNAKPRVEAHLLDFDEDIYGEPIEIEFADRVRGNIKFTTIPALIAQMNADIEQTREILSNAG